MLAFPTCEIKEWVAGAEAVVVDMRHHVKRITTSPNPKERGFSFSRLAISPTDAGSGRFRAYQIEDQELFEAAQYSLCCTM